MIQAGGISLLGLGTNHLSMLRSHAAAPEGAAAPLIKPNGKSVIYIFLSGGLSQHDSFDMKPDAPQEVRGDFQPIRTRTPGLRICEHLPELAKRSDLWSLCRSVTHPYNEHTQGHHVMFTGRSDLPTGFDPAKPKETDWPSMAAIAGEMFPVKNNLPPSIVLPEKMMHRSGRTLPGQFAGQLGQGKDPFFLEASRYNPSTYGAFPEYLFHHETGLADGSKFSFDAPNLSLPEGVGRDRMQGRLDLLAHLDGQQAHFENVAETRGVDHFQEMAANMLFDPKVKAAFDIDGADPKLLDRYGRNSFGWSLLMARQLVESGVRLVQVNLGNNECWDTHQSIFPNLKNFLMPPMDRAVSALLDDLSGRGLLDDTLIVMGSEFGRTPKISTLPGGKRLPGRDHWGAVQTMMFAGGGVQGGRAVGSSDKIGAYPETDAQTPEDVAATIYETLGLPRSLTWKDPVDRPHFVYGGHRIEGLYS